MNFLTTNPMTRVLPPAYYANVISTLMARLAPPQISDTDLLKKYRDYTVGKQSTPLNNDEQAILGEGVNYKLNICRPILNVRCDRLKVRHVAVTTPAEIAAETDETGAATLTASDLMTASVKRAWQLNSMDLRQRHTHWQAGRDGEAFIIVDYDEKKKRVRITPNEKFDGVAGMYGVASEENPSEFEKFVKKWKETYYERGQTKARERMNVYYEDRVEKWFMGAAQWQPYTLDGTQLAPIQQDDLTYEAAVLWWTHDGTENGIPLGFPVFPFLANANGGLTGYSDLADIVPEAQDVINMHGASLVAATRIAGFTVNFLFGDRLPGDDYVDVFPGAWVDNLKPDGHIYQTVPADLPQLISALEMAIRHAAMITNVPLSYMNMTGQVMAEGTQQQNEVALIAALENRQTAFGNAYEDMARLILKLEALYSESDPQWKILLGSTPDKVLEALDLCHFNCEWESVKVRDETAEMDRAVRLQNDLGVPSEIAWAKSGLLTSDEVTNGLKINRMTQLQGVVDQLRTQQQQTAEQLANANTELQGLKDERQPATA